MPNLKSAILVLRFSETPTEDEVKDAAQGLLDPEFSFKIGNGNLVAETIATVIVDLSDYANGEGDDEGAEIEVNPSKQRENTTTG